MAKMAWWRRFRAEEPTCESKHGSGGPRVHQGSPLGGKGREEPGGGEREREGQVGEEDPQPGRP
jgi:hypothetical protein